MQTVISTWKDSLKKILFYYESKRGSILTFFPKLFLFFMFLNIGCYWWAIFTAYPECAHGSAGRHYFLVQFPVGFLGAVFDSFSFFVTVYIIRRAIKSKGGMEYAAHISFDLIIAVLATFWVLFVFSVSGWFIELIESSAIPLGTRNENYENLLRDAIANPNDNLRNIYFGLIMGVSAGLPTCLHLGMFFRSCIRIFLARKKSTV